VTTSLRTLPFHQRLVPEHPGLRSAYQGSNPISARNVCRGILSPSTHSSGEEASVDWYDCSVDVAGEIAG
jgi:hypothetical protein